MLDKKPDAHQERVQMLHQQFFTLVWLGFRQMVSRLQKYHLTQPQFATLAALVRYQQPATMQQLTKVTFQDAPTMTGVVNRLLKMGLVRRTRSENDRRVVLVEATPEAVVLIEEIDRDLRDESPAGFSRISEDDLDKLEKMLDNILLILLEQNPHAEQLTLDTAKEWLRTFASDPLSFVKTQENNPYKLTLF